MPTGRLCVFSGETSVPLFPPRGSSLSLRDASPLSGVIGPSPDQWGARHVLHASRGVLMKGSQAGGLGADGSGLGCQTNGRGSLLSPPFEGLRGASWTPALPSRPQHRPEESPGVGLVVSLSLRLPGRATLCGNRWLRPHGSAAQTCVDRLWPPRPPPLPAADPMAAWVQAAAWKWARVRAVCLLHVRSRARSHLLPREPQRRNGCMIPAHGVTSCDHGEWVAALAWDLWTAASQREKPVLAP